jgi:hypothetical protein
MVNISKGYVYVLEDEFGRVKIGKSSNPTARFQSISTGSGLSIVKTYLTPTLNQYGDLELFLHGIFAEHRGIGEWFSVSFDEVVDYVKTLELSPYDKNALLENYIKISKRIVTKQRIRDKFFTPMEEKILFSILMFGNVKAKIIRGADNKPLNQLGLRSIITSSIQDIQKTMTSLEAKHIIKKIQDGKQVFYKLA